MATPRSAGLFASFVSFAGSVGSGGRLRVRRLFAAGLVLAAAASVLPATAGTAAPALSIEQVQRQIDALNTQVDRLAEAYDAAQIRLTATAHRAAVLRDAADRAGHSMAAVRRRLDAVAAAAYRSGVTSPFFSLLSTRDPNVFLDQMTALDLLAGNQRDEELSFLSAEQRLRSAQLAVQRQLRLERAAQQRLAAERTRILGDLAAEQALLARLNAAQRAALAAEQAARAAAAQAASRAAWRPPLYSGPATGQAAAAVRFAYAQLGKPYQWGAAGPYSYDCSGLTMASWGAAGVSLPHNAAMQQSEVPAVSPTALQPGDLLFFGSPAYHVGIYVGNGEMIDAPHTGANVELVGAGGFTSAGRP